VGIVIVLSGLVIWKPVQLQELTALFGGYDTARYVHFFAMAAILAFFVLHLALRFFLPKALLAMITGREAKSGKAQDVTHSKKSAWRRSRAPRQGCCQAHAESHAPPFSARRRESRGPGLSHRLRPCGRSLGRTGADEDFVFQRSRAGRAVRSEQARADLSRQRCPATISV